MRPDVEYIAERPDGTRFWFTPTKRYSRRGRPNHGWDQHAPGYYGSQNAQTQSEEQFRAIFETTPECVKIVSPDGTLLRMNVAGLSMVNASCAEEVIGKSVVELIAPEDREEFVAFNRRVCGGEKATLAFDIIGLGGNVDMWKHMRHHFSDPTAPWPTSL